MYIIRNKFSKQVLVETTNPEVIFKRIQPFERAEQTLELEIDGSIMSVADFVKAFYQIWGVHDPKN